MASLRGGRMSNEVEMNAFLYAILKQQDLKNVDWEAVARDRMITNGHAARMRFSRFKSAQEGTQSKPRKPRAQRESPVPRGAKARTAAKKAKSDKDKQREKMSHTTPPATPVKFDDDDEMALDSAPLAGMSRQLRLPTEPASFIMKPDLDTMQDDAQETEYIKTEPNLPSEASRLESVDIGQTADMLGQVNIDNYIGHHVHPGHLAPREVMNPRMMPARDRPASRERRLSPSSSSPFPRSRVSPELLSPHSLMEVARLERALFHRHYSNGMPILASTPGLNEVEKNLIGFEEHMRGCRSAGDVSMEESREPVVKEEQNWEENYELSG